MSPFAGITVAALAVVAMLPAGAVAEQTGFSPSQRSKTVEVGKTEKLDYKLQLPTRKPFPVDVYLLVDGSQSMAPALPAVRAGLADGVLRLARRGGDVAFGVGEFRTTAPHDWTDGFTYRRLQPVTVNSHAALVAVDRLGRDRNSLPRVVPGDDAHTVALDEAVTGNGQWPYVRPGQQAGFRSHARKVVVLVTDERFGRGGAQPSRDEAIRTLAAAGVQVVGLALHTGALEDLVAVARGTSSHAGSHVDCGTGRIAAGQPAACVTRPDYAGRTLERLLGTHGGEVTFTATGTGVRRLDPPVRWVDLTRKNKIDVKLHVACGIYDAGRTHAVTLTARIAGELVATARAAIRCKAKN